MSRAFETLKLPELIELGRARDTIGQYRRSVRRWEEFLAVTYCGETRTTSPGVCPAPCRTLADIEISHLDAFYRWLRACGYSDRERSKTVTDLQSILTRAEAVGHAELAVTRTPRLRRSGVQSRAAPKLYFSFPMGGHAGGHAGGGLGGACDLDALWLGCSVAEWPTRSRLGRVIDPVWQWRLAIVLYATYGFRTEELINGSAGGCGLCWETIHRQARTPSVGGHASNPWGWFHYVPQKQKWTKPTPLVLPITRVARAHLDRVPSRALGPVFDWPHCNRAFYAAWRRIVAAAGLAPIRDVVGGVSHEWQVRHFRKTCSTWINHFFPGMGGLVTGHASRGVEDTHYRNSELRVQEVLSSLEMPRTWQFLREDVQDVKSTRNARPDAKIATVDPMHNVQRGRD